MKVITENLWGTRLAVLDDTEQQIGTVKLDGWMSSATIEVDGETATLRNRKWYSSDKIIKYKGEDCGLSEIKFSFSKTKILVDFKGSTFTIQKKSLFSYEYEVLFGQNQAPAGTIVKDSLFKKNYTSNLPKTVEPLFQSVLVTVIIFLENYQAAVS